MTLTMKKGLRNVALGLGLGSAGCSIGTNLTKPQLYHALMAQSSKTGEGLVGTISIKDNQHPYVLTATARQTDNGEESLEITVYDPVLDSTTIYRDGVKSTLDGAIDSMEIMPPGSSKSVPIYADYDKYGGFYQRLLATLLPVTHASKAQAVGDKVIPAQTK